MESSRYWNSNDVGDGASAGFARALIAAWLSKIFSRGAGGILDRALNELAVTGTSSPLAVASGAAIVDGIFYENSASLNLTVTTPSAGTTGGRVILRASWSAQTVRAVIKLNTDGVAAIPALTQTPGTTYEINLASFTITTGGVIGSLVLEPTRASFSDSPRPATINLAALSVLGNTFGFSYTAEAISAGSEGQALVRAGAIFGFGQIATDGLVDQAVNLDKLSADAEAALKVHRQGGSASNWNTPGSGNYIADSTRILGGAISVTMPAASTGGFSVYVTLPVAMSAPLVFVTMKDAPQAAADNALLFAYFADMSGSTLRFIVYKEFAAGANITITLNWLAIGPEA
jgi:hypothetical protein